MKNKHTDFMQATVDYAEKSSFRQQMGAVVVHRGKIVGRGCNFAHRTGQPYVDGQHAEVCALNNTTARFRKDSTVYVARRTKTNECGLAKPCEACQKIMRKMGVRYVWYSSGEETWHRMGL